MKIAPEYLSEVDTVSEFIAAAEKLEINGTGWVYDWIARMTNDVN